MKQKSVDSVDPTAVPIDVAAKLLSRVCGRQITESWLREDIEAGASVNADGTLNLVSYAAWLVSQKPRNNDGH